MLGALLDDEPDVLLSEWDHLVEGFRLYCPDPASREGIRVGRPSGHLQAPHAWAPVQWEALLPCCSAIGSGSMFGPSRQPTRANEPMARLVTESPERSTAVVGEKLSGRFRMCIRGVVPAVASLLAQRPLLRADDLDGVPRLRQNAFPQDGEDSS
jgi:hypothetical protein